VSWAQRYNTWEARHGGPDRIAVLGIHNRDARGHMFLDVKTRLTTTYGVRIRCVWLEIESRTSDADPLDQIVNSGLEACSDFGAG
jgi:hypothetical protein